jgi:hypothetical protein
MDDAAKVGDGGNEGLDLGQRGDVAALDGYGDADLAQFFDQRGCGGVYEA